MNRPWCPWCFAAAVVREQPLEAAGDYVRHVQSVPGRPGQVLNPWDDGGWSCVRCLVALPKQAWAGTLIWMASALDHQSDGLYRAVEVSSGFCRENEDSNRRS